LLSLRSWGITVELLLINVHVHLLDKKAVSWDAVALVEQDNVTDNQVFDVNSLGGAILATENGDLFVHNFGLEAQELLLFAPIATGLDRGSEEDSEVDRDRFEPLFAGVHHEKADDQGDGGEQQKDLDVKFVELIPKDL